MISFESYGLIEVIPRSNINKSYLQCTWCWSIIFYASPLIIPLSVVEGWVTADMCFRRKTKINNFIIFTELLSFINWIESNSNYSNCYMEWLCCLCSNDLILLNPWGLSWSLISRFSWAYFLSCCARIICTHFFYTPEITYP